MKMKKGTKRKQPLNSSSSSSITKSLKRSKTIDIGNTEPYPDHPRPTPDECLAVRDALLALHGFPKEFLKYREQRLKKENPSFEKNSLKPELLEKLDVEEKSDSSGRSEGEESVLDGLVSTILSQNTTDVNSQRAFLSLKSAFPTWEDVLAAEPNHIEDAIRCGGLAPTKASCIKSILNCLFEKRGKLCLEYLRDLSIGEVKAELSQFKGIGPKTVACVLMFHLQQNDFPVDTHARIKNMDQNSSISFLLSPTRRCVDYFSCDTPVDNKRLKLFGFEIDSCQKSTTAPRSERDESVSSSDTVLAKADKNLPGKGCISVDSSKVVHSRTDELPKAAGNPLCSIELQKYKCEFCSKKFTNSQAFGGHQNAHRKERLVKKGIQLQAKRAGSNAKILSFSD